MVTETRCFHCKLDVGPVDEDGCCNNCGADLGCTCATEADTGKHTDDCALSVREERDRLARTISDIPAQLDAQLAAANKRATTAEHERDELRIAVGAPEDFAICSHRRFKKMARAERERDEALATIADFHKSRIRKQTEREAAMDAEVIRLTRTVDRKDEQMAELQDYAGRMEAALREIDVATRGTIRGVVVTLGDIARFALSPAPAQPATASRVCLGCEHFKHSNMCNCGCTMRPMDAQPATATKGKTGQQLPRCHNECTVEDGHHPDCSAGYPVAPPSPAARDAYRFSVEMLDKCMMQRDAAEKRLADLDAAAGIVSKWWHRQDGGQHLPAAMAALDAAMSPSPAAREATNWRCPTKDADGNQCVFGKGHTEDHAVVKGDKYQPLIDNSSTHPNKE